MKNGRPLIKLTETDVYFIVEAYKAGFGINSLATYKNVDTTSIRHHLVKANVYKKRRRSWLKINDFWDRKRIKKIRTNIKIAAETEKEKQRQALLNQKLINTNTGKSYTDYVKASKEFLKEQKEAIIAHFNNEKAHSQEVIYHLLL